MGKAVGRTLGRAARTAVLGLFVLLCLAPAAFLLIGSFMGNTEIYGHIAPVVGEAEGYADWTLLPMYPTLQNVIELLLDSPEFFHMFWNSAKVTVCIMGGQLLFGMPAAWGLSRYSFPGRKAVYMLYILLMMMPFQVTMLSEYLVLDRLKLLDTSGAVILPGMFATFSVFLMYRFFRGIPDSILEAARIDGAGEWQLFLKIGVPLGSSGIISAMVLSFLECWSMIEQPMVFFKTRSLWTLSLYLPEINGSNAGFCICASLMALLPAALVFLSGQDYLEAGIVASAVKE